MENDRPIFLQIAELIENAIIDGSLPEETQVPSTNELAAFHRINPATAAKGVNQLVDDGTLYKRRGIGMFVSPGARDKLRARRREEFADQYVRPAGHRGPQARHQRRRPQKHDRHGKETSMSPVVAVEDLTKRYGEVDRAGRTSTSP